MRKKLLFVAFLFGSIVSYAQEVPKVSTQETFDYNRCAISIISMGGGAFTKGISNSEFMSGKFDINKIPCTQIPVVGNEIVGKKKLVLNEKAEEIRKELLAQNVGKQVLDCWLQYDGNVFNSSLLAKRTRYNKTDADVLNANVDKVNTLNVADKQLIGNSYVVVLSESEDAKGVDAYVYHTILPGEMLAEVWNNWLDEDASPANRTFYNTLKVDLQLVAAINKKYEKPASNVLYASSILAGDLGSSLRKMAASSSAIDPVETLNEILGTLEHKIDKWQVTGTIFHRHPIAAKIGRKEGLRNSDRYRVLKVVEDESGNLEYKKVGFVRATEVFDNRTDAMGETNCSKFYKISGKTMKEGMFLKEKKDLKMSLGVSGGVLGRYNYAQVDIDYLLKTQNTLGMMYFMGISIGYHMGEKSTTTGSAATDELRPDYIPFSLNAAVAIHPVRILEIMPNIGIGGESCCSSDNTKSNNSKSLTKEMAYFARGGVKVGLQVFYPVQLFVRADYSYKFSEGELYVDTPNRFGKLSIGAGVKVNF